MQSFLLRLDAFRKVPKELTHASMHGAYLTVLAYVLMVILFLMELQSYFNVSVEKSVALDANWADTIWIDFDITMYELPCQHTHIVVRDVIGGNELPVLEEKITKARIDREGEEFGIAKHRDQPDPDARTAIDPEHYGY